MDGEFIQETTEDRIKDETVRALYGNVSTGEHGLMVTLGTYSGPAKAFARSKSNLRLIDGEELVDLLQSQ